VYVKFSRITLEKSGLHIFPCTINCQTRAEAVWASFTSAAASACTVVCIVTTVQCGAACERLAIK
jgi:hypothetical protein